MQNDLVNSMIEQNKIWIAVEKMCTIYDGAEIYNRQDSQAME